MLEMAEDPKNSFYYSDLHLVDFCRFGERLKHFEDGNWSVRQFDAEGNPDPSIILEPFEIWIESALQGFRNRSNGARLIKTALEMVPRKNSKSLRACRAALYELCCSGSMAPEIPIAASTGKQADDTLYDDIKKMVNADEELQVTFEIRVTKEEVTRKGGKIFKLTSQGERQDGLNPSLAIFEEGHAGAALVYKVVDSGFGAKPNQQRRMITTAGHDQDGPAWDLVAQAKMILEGLVEDWSFFAAIYTLDEADYMVSGETKAIDWTRLLTTESFIERCNPMYGVALDREAILRATAEGLKLRTDKRGEIARTRFNLWTNAGTTLIPAEQWAACKRQISLDQFIGQKCWIGVDLAESLDMCALVLLFELGDAIVAFAQCYLPEESATARHPELHDYLKAWEEQGHLYLTPGPMADHALVQQHVDDLCTQFDVQVIACDPRQAHATVKYFWDGKKPVMVFPNNEATMTAPTDDIIGRVAVQKLFHDGNPVFAWHAGNVCGERKGNGSIIPRKEKKDSLRKIDSFVALTFADGCRMQPEMGKEVGEKPPEDVYANTGEKSAIARMLATLNADQTAGI